uniref:Uncharacterized protein n=1 Tax=Timema monikensis TaxID=170555 RepID=A0A7R9DXY9_9NEOP|nr:unnamed protein product [Timema monikensis]
MAEVYIKKLMNILNPYNGKEIKDGPVLFQNRLVEGRRVLCELMTILKTTEDKSKVMEKRNLNLLAENGQLSLELRTEKQNMSELKQEYKAFKQNLERKRELTNMQFASTKTTEMKEKSTSSTNLIGIKETCVQTWLKHDDSNESKSKDPTIMMTKSELNHLQSDVQTLKSIVTRRDKAWLRMIRLEDEQRLKLAQMNDELIEVRQESEQQRSQLDARTETAKQLAQELKKSQKEIAILQKKIKTRKRRAKENSQPEEIHRQSSASDLGALCSTSQRSSIVCTTCVYNQQYGRMSGPVYPACPDVCGPDEWTYVMRRDMQEIIPGLFLGPYSSAMRSKLEQLTRLGITHIVCVRQDIESHFIRPNFPDKFKLVVAALEISFARLRYLTLNIADTVTENIIQHFSKMRQFVDESLATGGKTLVHGNAGISRSAALVLAYIMEKYGLTCKEAFSLVQQRRFCINPNEGFIAQLSEFEPIYKAQRTLQNGQCSTEKGRNKRRFDELDDRPNQGLMAEAMDVANS